MDDDLESALVELRHFVDEEITLAREKGLSWTPWREFISSVESIGAARCWTTPRPRYCKRVAEVVSYCTGFPGRVVLCGECLRRRMQQYGL